jgi:hypothetical protein
MTGNCPVRPAGSSPHYGAAQDLEIGAGPGFTTTSTLVEYIFAQQRQRQPQAGRHRLAAAPGPNPPS